MFNVNTTGRSAGVRITGWPAPGQTNHDPRRPEAVVMKMQRAPMEMSGGQLNLGVGVSMQQQSQQLAQMQNQQLMQQNRLLMQHSPHLLGLQQGGMGLVQQIPAQQQGDTQKLRQGGNFGQAQVGFQQSGFSRTPVGTTPKSVRPAEAFNVNTRGGATIARGPQYGHHTDTMVCASSGSERGRSGGKDMGTGEDFCTAGAEEEDSYTDGKEDSYTDEHKDVFFPGLLGNVRQSCESSCDK